VRGLIGRGRWLPAAVATAVLVLSACELNPPPGQNSSASPSSAVPPSPSQQPIPVAITAPSFHSGEVTVAYAPVALAATGGTPPYQWTVGGGALPAGLALSADGSLSGTPTAAGGFDFTAHVADTGGRTADVPASISITAAPSASLTAACAQYCAVEQGCDSTCGTFGTLSGGTAPFSYNFQGGYVPHGVSVSGLALAGTFTDPAKFWQFTVLVTDSLGASSAISPIFYVFPHISFPGGPVTCPYNGCGAPSMFAYQGGNGTPAVKVTGWTTGCTFPPCYVPPTPAVSASGGNVSIDVPPSGGGNGYQGVLTLLLTDQSLCSAGTKCSTSGTVNVTVQSG
jgi:hypothetical protein